jgi:hypothetical protein
MSNLEADNIEYSLILDFRQYAQLRDMIDLDRIHEYMTLSDCYYVLALLSLEEVTFLKLSIESLNIRKSPKLSIRALAASAKAGNIF